MKTKGDEEGLKEMAVVVVLGTVIMTDHSGNGSAGGEDMVFSSEDCVASGDCGGGDDNHGGGSEMGL